MVHFNTPPVAPAFRPGLVNNGLPLAKIVTRELRLLCHLHQQGLNAAIHMVQVGIADAVGRQYVNDIPQRTHNNTPLQEEAIQHIPDIAVIRGYICLQLKGNDCSCLSYIC